MISVEADVKFWAQNYDAALVLPPVEEPVSRLRVPQPPPRVVLAREMPPLPAQRERGRVRFS